MKLSKNNLSSFVSPARLRLPAQSYAVAGGLAGGHLSSRKGFTLIELLVIIAIVGVMAGAVVVAVNPLSKLNSAKLANVKTFSASVENALIMSQVGKWSFDDSVNPGKDTSGYGNDGIINGTTWKNPSECGLGFKGCLSFDGNDYVHVEQSTSNFASNFTIEAWVYRNQIECFNPNGGSYNCAIWGDEQDTDAGANEMGIAGDGLWCYFNIGSVWRSAIGGAVPLGQWSHVTCAYNGTNLSVWVNGENVKSVDANGSLAPSVFHRIGRSDGYKSAYWNGMIDEVKIYNKALLSYQIQQLYAQGLVKHLLALK